MYFLDITLTENDPGVTLHWFRGGWSHNYVIDKYFMNMYGNML